MSRRKQLNPQHILNGEGSATELSSQERDDAMKSGTETGIDTEFLCSNSKDFSDHVHGTPSLISNTLSPASPHSNTGTVQIPYSSIHPTDLNSEEMVKGKKNGDDPEIDNRIESSGHASVDDVSSQIGSPSLVGTDRKIPDTDQMLQKKENLSVGDQILKRKADSWEDETLSPVKKFVKTYLMRTENSKWYGKSHGMKDVQQDKLDNCGTINLTSPQTASAQEPSECLAVRVDEEAQNDSFTSPSENIMKVEEDNEEQHARLYSSNCANYDQEDSALSTVESRKNHKRECQCHMASSSVSSSCETCFRKTLENPVELGGSTDVKFCSTPFSHMQCQACDVSHDEKDISKVQAEDDRNSKSVACNTSHSLSESKGQNPLLTKVSPLSMLSGDHKGTNQFSTENSEIDTCQSSGGGTFSRNSCFDSRRIGVLSSESDEEVEEDFSDSFNSSPCLLDKNGNTICPESLKPGDFDVSSSIYKRKVGWKANRGSKENVCHRQEKYPNDKQRISIDDVTVLVTRLDGINLHTGIKTSLFKCHLCSKIFDYLSKVQSHLSIHFDHNANSFECLHCDAKFGVHSQLLQHEYFHSSQMKCALADIHSEDWSQQKTAVGSNIMSGSADAIMNSHDISDTLDESSYNNKESDYRKVNGVYVCQICNKGFCRFLSFQRHRQVRTGYKPSLCKYCCKGFSRARNRRQHISCLKYECRKSQSFQRSCRKFNRSGHLSKLKGQNTLTGIAPRLFNSDEEESKSKSEERAFSSPDGSTETSANISHEITPQLSDIAEFTEMVISKLKKDIKDDHSDISALTFRTIQEIYNKNLSENTKDKESVAREGCNDQWGTTHLPVSEVHSSPNRESGRSQELAEVIRETEDLGADVTVVIPSDAPLNSNGDKRDIPGTEHIEAKWSGDVLDATKLQSNFHSSSEIVPAPVKSLITFKYQNRSRRKSTAGKFFTLPNSDNQEQSLEHQHDQQQSLEHTSCEPDMSPTNISLNFPSSASTSAQCPETFASAACKNISDNSLSGVSQPLHVNTGVMSSAVMQLIPRLSSPSLLSYPSCLTSASPIGSCFSPLEISPDSCLGKNEEVQRQIDSAAIKSSSLSRTHSRLDVVKSPVQRDEVCRPICLPDGRQVFRCIYCHKDFGSFSDINRHMDFHEDIRPYKCKYCDYFARTNSQLKVHMMRHQGIRSHHCKLCNYKGVTQSDLNRHMKSQIHLLKANNACQMCGEGFVSLENLAKHTPRCQGVCKDAPLYPNESEDK